MSGIFLPLSPTISRFFPPAKGDFYKVACFIKKSEVAGSIEAAKQPPTVLWPCIRVSVYGRETAGVVKPANE